MEVTFQNKTEDLGSYIDYFLLTQEGKKFSQEIFRRFQLACLGFLGFIVVVQTPNSDNNHYVFYSLGLLAFIELIYFSVAKFNPKFYYGKKAMMQAFKKWTPEEKSLFQRQKKILISNEWLKLITADSTHKWRWNMVDQIGSNKDFTFITISTNIVHIVPKRDFISDYVYQEFEKELVTLFENKKNQPIGMEIKSSSKE